MSKPDRIYTREELTRDMAVDCDVAVVGSGAGGGVVAAELAEAGLDVAVFEEGGYHPTSSFNAEASESIRRMYRDGGASMSIGAPPVLFSEGRLVGGSTVLNGGMTWRTPERILERWRAEDQVDAITPEEMEPYFQRVERFLSAKTQDPESIGTDNRLLKEGAEKKGWKVIDNIRNQVHCAGTNNCAFGCPVGAKRSVLVTYVPRALTFGARIYANTKVDKLTFHGGRATGLTAHVVRADATAGARLTVRAKAVVVACGSIQTPALLMRSGVRSASKRIGHDLAMHPNTKVQAVFDEKVDGWKGVHQAYQVRQFEEEGIVFAAVNVPPGLLAMTMPHYGKRLRELMGQYHRIVNAGILLEDSQFGRVRLGPGGMPLPFYKFSDKDAERAVRGTALLCELLFAAGAKSIASPFHGVPDLNSPDDVKKLYTWKIRKADIELFTVHLMGTARMGGDPKRHVCDSYGKVYGVEGLWVSDASLFPSPIGVNPMETIMSLSTRNALRMIETASAWRKAA